MAIDGVQEAPVETVPCASITRIRCDGLVLRAYALNTSQQVSTPTVNPILHRLAAFAIAKIVDACLFARIGTRSKQAVLLNFLGARCW